MVYKIIKHDIGFIYLFNVPEKCHHTTVNCRTCLFDYSCCIKKTWDWQVLIVFTAFLTQVCIPCCQCLIYQNSSGKSHFYSWCFFLAPFPVPISDSNNITFWCHSVRNLQITSQQCGGHSQPVGVVKLSNLAVNQTLLAVKELTF